ncbi:hypothetical protein LJB93_00060 [Desulfovibrio sp. OttesenSCG-928-F07]|nr:hypothetical protein [Desulfovibrio sp. OttesenSCG-928-F07]
MIPCHVCGKNAETCWVIGFPPAPDSQKMGLCSQHNTPANRLMVQELWQGFIQKQIGDFTRFEASKQGGVVQFLSIYFTGGGSISIPCSAYSASDNNTLKITTPNGEIIFFPLVQVRNYAVTPLDIAPEELSLNIRQPKAIELSSVESLPQYEFEYASYAQLPQDFEVEENTEQTEPESEKAETQSNTEEPVNTDDVENAENSKPEE